VSVFPNPSNGEFTLTLPAFKGQAQVALKTLQGRTVFRKAVGQQQSKLAPGKLTTGVYLLQVTLDGKTVTKKVQIQK
jgi:microcystin-dependent protein